MAKKLPDYQMTFLNKKTEEKGAIGAGWDNADGSITLKLNPLVVLAASPDVTIRLWPNDRTSPSVDEKPF